MRSSARAIIEGRSERIMVGGTGAYVELYRLPDQIRVDRIYVPKRARGQQLARTLLMRVKEISDSEGKEVNFSIHPDRSEGNYEKVRDYLEALCDELGFSIEGDGEDSYPLERYYGRVSDTRSGLT